MKQVNKYTTIFFIVVLLASIQLLFVGNINAAEKINPPTHSQSKYMVKLTTTSGQIIIELDTEKAPITVANFLNYVRSGHYNGLIFHRVIPRFMIQGGGYEADMSERKTLAAIKNEAYNGLENNQYTLAMARTSDPHSATAQFFINVAQNQHLNHTEETANGWGYTVFGRVLKGTEVVDQIAAVETARFGPYSDVPKQVITIEKAELIEDF